MSTTTSAQKIIIDVLASPPDNDTFTYLVANAETGSAILIDPDKAILPGIRQVMGEKGLTLKAVMDTHTHADHYTGAPELLAEMETPAYYMHENGKNTAVTHRVKDNEMVNIDGIEVEFLYSPGHTKDLAVIKVGNTLFTGDCLFLTSMGRTDFGAAKEENTFEELMADEGFLKATGTQFNSIQRIKQLGEANPDLVVRPGHDDGTKNTMPLKEMMANLDHPMMKYSDQESFVKYMAKRLEGRAKPEGWQTYVNENVK